MGACFVLLNFQNKFDFSNEASVTPEDLGWCMWTLCYTVVKQIMETIPFLVVLLKLLMCQMKSWCCIWNPTQCIISQYCTIFVLMIHLIIPTGLVRSLCHPHVRCRCQTPRTPHPQSPCWQQPSELILGLCCWLMVTTYNLWWRKWWVRKRLECSRFLQCSRYTTIKLGWAVVYLKQLVCIHINVSCLFYVYQVIIIMVYLIKKKKGMYLIVLTFSADHKCLWLRLYVS